jgi:hypothetical protein
MRGGFQVIVERCAVAVVPLLLRTSERFLWVLAAAEAAFARAARAPWPPAAPRRRPGGFGSGSGGGFGPSSGGGAGAAARLARWTLVVRQLQVTALRLNLNYAKGGGGSRPAPPLQPPHAPSDSSFLGSGGSRGVSVASNAAFSSALVDGDAATGGGNAALSTAGTTAGSGRNGGSGATNSSNQYPESVLGFALRALRVSLTNATVELRRFALVAWRGTADALAARLAHHYLAQLKQWTFTLLTAASPSFGFGYFRSNHPQRALLPPGQGEGTKNRDEKGAAK